MKQERVEEEKWEGVSHKLILPLIDWIGEKIFSNLVVDIYSQAYSHHGFAYKIDFTNGDNNDRCLEGL